MARHDYDWVDDPFNDQKNEQLKQAKYSAVPSNRTVARMLNLDDRKVASILQLARNGVQPQADALGEDS